MHGNLSPIICVICRYCFINKLTNSPRCFFIFQLINHGGGISSGQRYGCFAYNIHNHIIFFPTDNVLYVPRTYIRCWREKYSAHFLFLKVQIELLEFLHPGNIFSVLHRIHRRNKEPYRPPSKRFNTRLLHLINNVR